MIYTGDITRDQVSAEYHIGAVRLTVETAFLSELHSEEIYQRLKRKVEKNEKLDNEELMEFIILPLSYPKKFRSGTENSSFLYCQGYLFFQTS